MRDVSVERMRTSVLVVGLAALAVIATTLWMLAVDGEEVLAATFFLPVFAAAVVGGARWGLMAGLMAAIAYLGVRLDDLAVLASAQQWFRPVAYGIAYLGFGGLAGWAAAELTAGIDKLERFDVTDDGSGLLNARGLHRQLEQELARARRYGSDFAVVTVSFEVVGDTGERARVRRQVGDAVRGSVRTVDDTGRVTVDGRDLVVAVLPETSRVGAEAVGAKISALLRSAGGTDGADVRWLTPPADDAAIDALLDTLAAVVARDHPGATPRA